MSNYSNFVGYVPDKLRLETTGGALVEGELGLPNEYIASLSIGPVSTGAYVSNPGIALDAAATFTIESGSSYIQFKNLTATKNAIVVTGALEGSGTDFEADFSNLEYVGYQITGRSDRLKKFSLGALKRIDSLDGNLRIALYYSGGHDVTGEVYSPNLVQAAGYSGIFLNYGSGGLKGLDNTFTGYVSGMVIISGHADYGSSNNELLPYEDFLPVHQVGGVKFWAGSNWENVVLGMNHTGVGLGNGNTSSTPAVQGLTWNIYTHQNTTGVVIPLVVNEGVNAYVSTPTTNTGDLTITCSGAPLTKPSGFYNRLDFNQNTDGRNLTVINNSNEYFYIPYVGNIGAINIKSSGSLNFSGLCLTGVSQQYVNSTSRWSKFQATDDIVVNLTTGTFLAGRSNSGANGGCVFWAVSESGNVTLEALNLEQTNVGWVAQLNGSGTTGLINLPEATGLIPTGTNPHGTSENGGALMQLYPGGANAVDTVQTINIPKLQQYSGTLTAYGLSGSTTTISGADLTSWSGAHNFYTSGDLYYTFTGGGGDGSGEVIGSLDNRTYLSGNTHSGNRGTLRRCNALTYSLSGVHSTGILVANELREINGNITLHGLSGATINVTGADVDYISGSLVAYTSGNINCSFTGGPGTGGGYMTSHLYIRNYTTGNTFTGNFGTLRSGLIVSGYIYSGDSTISIYATGMNQWNGNHYYTAPVATSGDSNSKFTIDFGDIDHLSGFITATLYSTGHTFNYNHGSAKSGYLSNYLYCLTYGANNDVTWNMGSLKNMGSNAATNNGYLFAYQNIDLNATGMRTTFNATGLQDAGNITGYINYGSTGIFNLNTFHARARIYAQAYAGGTYLADGTGDLPATTGGSVDYIQHYALYVAGSGQLTTVSGTYGGYVTGVGNFCHAYDNAGSGYTYIGLPNLTGYSDNATYLNAYSNRTTQLGSGYAEIYAPQWTWSGSQYWQAYVQSENTSKYGATAKITIGDAVKVGQYIAMYAEGNNSLTQITLTGNTAYEIGRNNTTDYLNVHTQFCDAATPAKVTGLLGNLQVVSGYYQLYNYASAPSGRIVVQTTGLKRVTHYIQVAADASGAFVSGNLGKLESVGYGSQTSSLAVYARATGATSYLIATGDPGYEATGEIKHGMINGAANGGYCETRINNFRSCNYVNNYATGTAIMEATGLQSITGNSLYHITLGYYHADYPTLVSGNFPNLHENSGYLTFELFGQATGYLNYNTARTSGFIDDYVLIRGRNSDPNISGYVNLGGTTDVRNNFFQVITSGDWVIDATGITNVTGYTQLAAYGKSAGSGITSVTGNFSNTKSGFTVEAIGTSGHIQFTSNYTGIFEPQIWATGRTNTSIVELNLDSMDAIGASGVRLRNSGTTFISMTGMRCISGGYDLQQVGDTSTRGYGTHGLETVTALTGIATAVTGYNNLSGTLFISGNTYTGDVNPTALQQIGYESVAMSYTSGVIIASGIKTAKFPALTGWYGAIRMELPAITGFDMSSLVWMGASGTSGSTGGDNQRLYRPLYFEFGSNLTGDLDLGALQHIHVYSNNTDGAPAVNGPAFQIIGSGLTSVSMAAVITGSTQGQSSVIRSGVIEGSNITGLTFGASGTTKKMEMHFMASGCALNQASVDATLQMFASLDGTNSTTTYSGLTITLNGLCAAPSAAGSGYRDTLTGAGRDCTVLINS